jgi:hypothetical protein
MDPLKIISRGCPFYGITYLLIEETPGPCDSSRKLIRDKDRRLLSVDPRFPRVTPHTYVHAVICTLVQVSTSGAVRDFEK